MNVIDYIKKLPIRSFDKDELLYASGDDSSVFLAIRDGFIKVTSTDENGRQKLLWIAGRYDILPLERFFSNKVLQYDYTGYTSGSAYQIKKPFLHELMQKYPELNAEIARGMSEHYDDVFERLSAVGQSDVRRKLLHMLYTLTAKFSTGTVVKLHDLGLNLTHQDIADMIGASREVVSVELNKARSDGFVDYSRSTFTVNMDKIRDELGLLA